MKKDYKIAVAGTGYVGSSILYREVSRRKGTEPDRNSGCKGYIL